MAEFLTTNGTSYYIEKIIIEAKSELNLVTPYLKLTKIFFERLKDACNRGVEIRIVYGKDQLNPNEKNSLAELKNLKLLFLQNLHAKCYMNESYMVITSMNMYEFSEKNNREMGILVDRKTDQTIYDQAVKEIQSIVHHSDRIGLQKIERHIETNKKSGKAIPTNGYCIRCETRIQYDPSKPFCWECYQVWAQYENPNFRESVCHCCGEYNSTSMTKPQCKGCERKYPAPTM